MLLGKSPIFKKNPHFKCHRDATCAILLCSPLVLDPANFKCLALWQHPQISHRNVFSLFFGIKFLVTGQLMMLTDYMRWKRGSRRFKNISLIKKWGLFFSPWPLECTLFPISPWAKRRRRSESCSPSKCGPTCAAQLLHASWDNQVISLAFKMKSPKSWFFGRKFPSEKAMISHLTHWHGFVAEARF